MGDARNPPAKKEVTANVEFTLKLTEDSGLREKDFRRLLDDATGPTVMVDEVEFDD